MLACTNLVQGGLCNTALWLCNQTQGSTGGDSLRGRVPVGGEAAGGL